MRSLTIVLLCGVAVSACNNEPPKKTVFDTQVKALEKARNVQDTVNEAGARERENIERQEGAPASSN